MNKSHSLKFKNQKSLSGLNNINVFDAHVSNKLSTENVDNVDTAITTLQSNTGSSFNQSAFTGNIIPDTDGLQDIASSQKMLQNLYANHLLCYQLKSPNFNNAIGINTNGLCTFYNGLSPINNTIDIGASNAKFHEGHFEDLFTTNHDVDAKLTSLTTSTQLNSNNINSNNIAIQGNSSILSQHNTSITDLESKTDPIALSPGNFEIDTSQIYFYINSVQRLRIDSDVVLTADGAGTMKFKQGNSVRYQVSPNGNAVYNNPSHEFKVSNSTKMTIGSNQTVFRNNISVNQDAVFDLASSSNRFRDAYIRDGVTTSSDIRDKYYIQKLEEDKMVQFIKDLEPIRYKWVSEKRNKTPRFHVGLSAQDTQKKMPFDWGLLIHDQETDKYMLRYQELIGVLISVNQNLIKRLEYLESKII